MILVRRNIVTACAMNLSKMQQMKYGKSKLENSPTLIKFR
jgi:hypothetical protein